MKAVIMAGGEGSRLRPLTCDIPKPMARLCGRPVLEYILELLAEHGAEEAAITLRYLPDRIIDHFPQERFAGVRLRFVEETEPLGTAGGVRNACPDVREDILVISGDAMCDFDLTAFRERHRASGADVTILGKRVEDPREYGLINLDEAGNILGFLEKPAFSQAISDMANTGIYLLSPSALERIPADRPFDFARDLFPLMLQEKRKLVCHEGKGYWCDIGDLDSYIRCQQDMLHQRVRCSLPGVRDAQGNVVNGRPLHAAVRITPPVYIGKHVRVDERAVIESGSVLDDGCRVDQGARVSGSILLQNSQVARRARLTGALVCAGASIKAGAMLFEGATVGAEAVVGEKATVHAGIKIWNRKRVPPSSVVTGHLKTSAQAREFFDDTGITGQVGVELTPEFAARLGCAVGSLDPAAKVAVGRSVHPASEVLSEALCAGIRSTGADVVDFGANFQSRFEFSMNFCASPVGVYVRGDSRAGIRVMGPGGLPATRAMERDIEGILSRGEFIRSPWDQTGDRVSMSGMGAMYRSRLVRCAPKGLTGCAVQVKCGNPVLKESLREVLYRLGCDLGSGPVLELSAQGDRVRLCDPDRGYIHHHRIFAWCCLAEMERGMDIAVPFDAPRVIDQVAEGLDRQVLRYYTCPADDSDAEARKLAAMQQWSRDGLMQALIFLSQVRSAGSVEALMEKMPAFDRAVRTVDTGKNPAALFRKMGNLESSSRNIPEGVLLKDSRGTVLVRPLKRGTGLRIFAEAVSAEIAAELCDDVEGLIRGRMEA